MSTEAFDKLTLNDLAEDEPAQRFSFQESVQKILRDQERSASQKYGFDFTAEKPLLESKDSEFGGWCRSANEIEYQ